jgi:isocitrate dehydrogenase kinase/phosphatase
MSNDDRVVTHVNAIANAAHESEVYDIAARWIRDEFDDYYTGFCTVPAVAKLAFEQRNPVLSVSISRKRLSMYSISMRNLGGQLKKSIPFNAEDQSLWDKLETRYWNLIRDRYDADLALAYLHSVRRTILRGEWKPVAYSFGRTIETGTLESEAIVRTFRIGGRLDDRDVAAMLCIPGFNVAFRDIEADSRLSTHRANGVLDEVYGKDVTIDRVELVNAGFYRNRGVYVVGRIVLDNGDCLPLIFALLNDESGIYVDAILHTDADAHNLFSSTLANFHVTTAYYHELAGFLHTIMPDRPIGLHYTTVGYNHFGKVAVMNELRDEVTSTGEVFESSPGFKGTVAIGFSTPSSAFHLKIIRDTPTEGYKWGTFEGVDVVLKKYSRVHDINRTGSMLDNIIYHNVKLDKGWFDPILLAELLDAAPGNVSEHEGGIIFKHLIVQIRMVPLPVFLNDAAADDASTAIVNLGHCIKNNMAANIFNKDLDARNYGVSKYLKVYLYDYDALETFTDVKIRTNIGRYEGEEDVPDWVFEDGVVFLPEELESGLRIPNRALTRVFRYYHGDLLTTEYWQNIQDALSQSAVPSVRVYPEERKLGH